MRGGRGGGVEERPGGGVTRERRRRKWRQKKRDSAVKVGPCNDSLTRIFVLLLSPAPLPTRTHWAIMSNFLAPSLKKTGLHSAWTHPTVSRVPPKPEAPVPLR